VLTVSSMSGTTLMLLLLLLPAATSDVLAGIQYERAAAERRTAAYSSDSQRSAAQHSAVQCSAVRSVESERSSANGTAPRCQDARHTRMNANSDGYITVADSESPRCPAFLRQHESGRHAQTMPQGVMRPSIRLHF
jgi:hypothetical protein